MTNAYRSMRLVTVNTFSSAILALAGLFTVSHAQPAHGWEYVGDLESSTAFHSVVKLDESRVMVLGDPVKGSYGANQFVGCSIIDANARTIRSVSSMRFSRTAFAAIKMSDDRVYAIGGQSAFGVGGEVIVEEYDHIADTWSPAGYLVEGRGQVAAAAINDHEIIIVGGRIGMSDVRSTCEIFDVVTGRSRRIADFPYRTSFAKVIVTSDGRILSFSGRSGGPGSYRTGMVHEYEVNQDVWTAVGEMESAVYYPSVAQSDDGQTALVGGSWREGNIDDDFATAVQLQVGSSFKNVGSLIQPRAGHGATGVGHGTVIAVGGADNHKNAYRSTEFVNVVSGVVERGPDLLFPRMYCQSVGVTVHGMTAVLVIGGTSSSGDVKQVEILVIDKADEPASCTQTVLRLVPDQELLEYAGQAEDAGAYVYLNRMETMSSGAIWFNDRIRVSAGFISEFSFRLIDGDDNGVQEGSAEGGSGLALVIQGITPSPIGSPGAGLGYDQMVNGVAVEFDMYRDEDHADPLANHVAVHKGDGYVLRSLHEAPYEVGTSSDEVPDFRADGTVYYARIVYDGRELSIWVNDTQVYGEPTLQVEIDLNQALTFQENDMAWIGITGATGVSVQSHEILTWDITACSELPHIVDRTSVEEGEISIYPMPTSTRATIKFDGTPQSAAHVRVMSMTGELLIDEMVFGPQFDLSAMGMPAGTFILNIEYDGRSTSTLWKVVR